MLFPELWESGYCHKDRYGLSMYNPSSLMDHSDIDCRVGTGRWVEISWRFVIQYTEVIVIGKLFQIFAPFWYPHIVL